MRQVRHRGRHPHRALDREISAPGDHPRDGRSADRRLPIMTFSRLLKSWATPPVSCPIASIFCGLSNASPAPLGAVASPRGAR